MTYTAKLVIDIEYTADDAETAERMVIEEAYCNIEIQENDDA